MPPRFVRLVLVTRAGDVVGQWAPFPVEVPWWAECASVVRATRERHGVTVTLLRMLEAELPSQPGGTVTYLAEVGERVEAEPWAGTLGDHPLRLGYARPGGPAADLAWADATLASRGSERIAPAEQIKTWNLSSLWRLPVRGQTVWLKVVPPFFGHEGAVIERLADQPVPRLLAHEGPRSLTHEIRGDDLYEATLPTLARMVPLLVDIQQRSIDRVDEWLALGLPDWRGDALVPSIIDVVERTAAELTPEDRTTLGAFIDGLPRRLRDLAACGIPDTLVHGDFHPGNLRGDDTSLTCLDWGDSGVGHPMFDQPAFLSAIVPDAVEPIRALWHEAWRTAVPGADPARAAALLAPVAACRQAVIYRGFLDRIEPSEHPYHNGDSAIWLKEAARLVRTRA